jgi:glycosyltransferase involved in cell wall biosynthesis
MTELAAWPAKFSPPAVSVVIPTLNEASNLPHVLPLIPSWIDEVVIVDGLSTDGSVDVARRLLPDVRVVLADTPGKGAALRAGFLAARGDIVVAMDADGSTEPHEIAGFVGMVLSGADVVVGSRFIQGGGTDDMERHRRAGNRMLTLLVRLGFRARFTDLCYGFFAFRREVLPLIEVDRDGFEVEALVHIRAAQSNLRVAEVPSFEARRIHGTSNLHTFRDGFRVLRGITSEWLAARSAPWARRAASAHGDGNGNGNGNATGNGKGKGKRKGSSNGDHGADVIDLTDGRHRRATHVVTARTPVGDRS